MVWDYVVVGQGMAGSCLAWILDRHYKKKVLIVDQNHKQSASQVAAGLITPITGKRFIYSWKFRESIEQAVHFYQHLKQEFGEEIFVPKDILRIFQSQEELKCYQGLSTDAKEFSYIKEPRSPGYHSFVNDSWGSVVIHGGGYCRMDRCVKLIAEQFQRHGQWQDGYLKGNDLKVGTDFIEWKAIKTRHIIFCEGFQAHLNPWFCDLPWNHAKGEILTLRMKKPYFLSEDQIINCGKWLLPLGKGIWKMGSTYTWEPLDTQPTPDGQKSIIDHWQQYCDFHVTTAFSSSFPSFPTMNSDQCGFDIVDHVAGVRPVLKDLKPVLGRHPQISSMSIFNGFGSKASLLAPYFAHQLLEHLEHNVPLDPEVDIKRFLTQV